MRHFSLRMLLLCLFACPLLGHIIPSNYAREARHSAMGFEAIFQFGDSLSDTGNLIRERPATAFARLPYGQTFHRPTGRCSDGLLMVDYFAIYFGLPLLNPYLARRSDFSHGVNFAVAGATALEPEALASRNITLPLTASSLTTQLAWFKSHLNSTYSDPTERTEKLGKSLVLMGEIGGNDYNFAFFQGRTIDEAYQLVPDVVQTIKDGVKEVIELGARNVVVPGNFPIGCVPIYLVKFQSDDPSMYDELQCLKDLNDFSKFHNDRLQEAIAELQRDYPDVAIAYGDYFNAMKWVVSHASSLGFETGGSHKTCCATGRNPYNYDVNHSCGGPGVPVCADPTKRVSWDGIHMTQQANKYVAKWLLRNFVPKLNLQVIP